MSVLKQDAPEQHERLCECGCGQKFVCDVTSKKRFINTHHQHSYCAKHRKRPHAMSDQTKRKIGLKAKQRHATGLVYTQEVRDKVSKSLKGRTYLDLLGSEEKVIERKNKMLKSLEGRKKYPYKKGWYRSIFGEEFFYESSYELSEMRFLDTQGIKWTKRHNILVPYEWEGKKHHTKPDFLVETKPQKTIIETKGRITEFEACKIQATEDWCKANNYIFHLMTDTKLREMGVMQKC